MAISDVYTLDSGLVSVATTVQTPILLLSTAATKRAWITGCRVSIGVTAAAAGNDILFTVARAGNTPSGGTPVTPSAHDFSAPASLTTGSVGAWTTAPTQGTKLAEWTLPQTTGSMWEEFPPLGYEWGVPVSGWVAVLVTASVATSTPVQAQLIFSE